jgi:two-component system sensor histidine kinase RegB
MDREVSSSRARGYLRQLVRMRWLAACVGAALLYSARTALDLEIPAVPVLGVLALYALLNAATVQRLHGTWPRFWSRYWPVTERELMLQMLVDVAALSAALYFAGGGINPLAASYLVLVVYASVTLPSRLAWTIAAACMLCYAGLHFFNTPLPLADTLSGERKLNYFAHFNIYVALAALVAGYGGRISEMRRVNVARARADAEKDARERYLVGLAALSAGTAHQMSTPLSTMALVVGDLRESDLPPADWKQSIEMLWGQIQICKRSLEAMAQGSDVERLGKVRSVPAAQFVRDIAERFRALRPQVQLKVSCARMDDALILSTDPTLPQAVLNILGNAADASPHSVELRAGLEDDLRLAIQVLDSGPGIAPALRERIGKEPVTTKESGHGSGAGTLIACAAVERFAGRIHISERYSGGTMVQIELPLYRAGTQQRGEDNDYRGLRIA